MKFRESRTKIRLIFFLVNSAKVCYALTCTHN